jgi:hypothetical protein
MSGLAKCETTVGNRVAETTGIPSMVVMFSPKKIRIWRFAKG